MLDSDALCFTELKRLHGLGEIGPDDQENYRRSVAKAAEALAGASPNGALVAAAERVSRDPTLLDGMLERQFFKLHGWKLAGEVVNYRRFFDIGSLIGIRAESQDVVATTHARIATMIAAGELAGLRIDHPDGLRDPKAYFQWLRALLPHGRLYVEKILDNDERLKADWSIDGTVGYDFLAKVNRLWMDNRRIDALTGTYADFTGHSIKPRPAGAGEKARRYRIGLCRGDGSDGRHGFEHRPQPADARHQSTQPAGGTGQSHHRAPHLPDVPYGRYQSRGRHTHF